MPLQLPDPRLFEPRLFIPGTKPLRGFEVDQTHPIGSQLALYCCPDADGFSTDLLVGDFAKVADSVLVDVDDAPCISGQSAVPTNLAYTVGNKFSSDLTTGLTVFSHFRIRDDLTNIDAPLVGKYRSGFGPWRMFRSGNEDWNRETVFSVILNDGTGNTAFNVSEDSAGSRITIDFAPHCAVGVWIPGDAVYLYIDGSLIASTPTPAGYTFDTRDYQVHLVGGDRLEESNGPQDIYSTGIIPTAITLEQAASLSADPYQFLRPVGPSTFFVSTGLSITAEDPAAQADVGPTAIQQLHTLTADNSAVQGESDTGAISQTHQVVTDDSTAQADTGTAAINQTHQAVATDADGQGAIDAGVIQQTHVLTVDDPAAQAAPDSGAVSTGSINILTADDPAGQAEADTGAALQTHQTVVTDAEGLGTIDANAAQQTHILTADDPSAQADPETGAVSTGDTHILSTDNPAGQADAETAAAQQAHQLTAQESTAQADADTGAAQQTNVLVADDPAGQADPDTGPISVGSTHVLTVEDTEGQGTADTTAVSQIHQPVAADAEGQSAMDALGITQAHTLTALDPAAQADAVIMLSGIGPISNPRSIDITPTYSTESI